MRPVQARSFSEGGGGRVKGQVVEGKVRAVRRVAEVIKVK